MVIFLLWLETFYGLLEQTSEFSKNSEVFEWNKNLAHIKTLEGKPP
jgi:hypothetical protein